MRRIAVKHIVNITIFLAKYSQTMDLIVYCLIVFVSRPVRFNFNRIRTGPLVCSYKDWGICFTRTRIALWKNLVGWKYYLISFKWRNKLSMRSLFFLTRSLNIFKSYYFSENLRILELVKRKFKVTFVICPKVIHISVLLELPLYFPFLF